tara:strand:+ start:44 stop:490 length:447 start_codon:yes stop_codon:yes gene_type:complete
MKLKIIKKQISNPIHITAIIIKNIDYKKEFYRTMNLFGYIEEDRFFKNKYEGYSSSSYKNLYGKYNMGEITIKNKNKNKNINFYKLDYILDRCGIEILGMKPSVKTKDGKFKYEGITIKQLQKSCKGNGLKKYSKYDKLGLVKLLMTI